MVNASLPQPRRTDAKSARPRNRQGLGVGAEGAMQAGQTSTIEDRRSDDLFDRLGDILPFRPEGWRPADEPSEQVFVDEAREGT